MAGWNAGGINDEQKRVEVVNLLHVCIDANVHLSSAISLVSLEKFGSPFVILFVILFVDVVGIWVKGTQIRFYRTLELVSFLCVYIYRTCYGIYYQPGDYYMTTAQTSISILTPETPTSAIYTTLYSHIWTCVAHAPSRKLTLHIIGLHTRH